MADFVKKHYHGEHDSYDRFLQALSIKSVHKDEILRGFSVKGRNKDTDKLLNHFLFFNRRGFDFLNIRCFLNDAGNNITFKTGNIVGCIPLFSPVSGKPYAALFINGRFNEDIGALLPYTNKELEIDFDSSLKLPYVSSVKPPLYYECAKFIDKYFEVKKLNWKKFISEDKVQNYPSGSTKWGQYAVNSSDPYKVLKFPNRKNTLTKNHLEWKQVNYVLKLCAEEISRSSTPKQTFRAYQEKIVALRAYLSDCSVERCGELRIHSADPLAVKEIKTIGNRILSSISVEYRAWRLDFSHLYEGYVQYLFGLVAKSIGARIFNNHKYSISGNRTSWGLSYLEPDILIKKGNCIVAVDAKYKTHMLNIKSESISDLHDEFRNDLHQILAYTSLNSLSSKTAILVYPSNRYVQKNQIIGTPLSSAKINLYLIGIPFGNSKDIETIKRNVEITKNRLTELFSTILI